jgi:two-component system, NarL family, sensor kinase
VTPKLPGERGGGPTSDDGDGRPTQLGPTPPAELLAAGELLEAAWRRTDRDRRYLVDSLHDNVVQALLALTWQLDDLGGPAAAELRHQIDAVVTDMWTLIGELHPTAVADGSLAGAIRSQIQEMTRSHGLAFELDLGHSEAPVDADRQLVLLRVCREAVSNTLSHAQATTVRIRCRHRPGGVILHVADDGVGCDPDVVVERMRRGSYGLRSVSWALTSHGGGLRICTRPGAGFSVHARIPTT